jgi:hypothetical protein
MWSLGYPAQDLLDGGATNTYLHISVATNY